jgi:hypothetical protein
MAIKKSKEKLLQYNGTVEDAMNHSLEALKEGGFKSIERNDSLQQLNAKFNNFFAVGTIDLALSKSENGTTISIKSRAHVDNVYRLFKSPNDTIIKSFSEKMRNWVEPF